ncbi:MAG: HRDC domain-containing protein [Rhodospirillaceae bacterium]
MTTEVRTFVIPDDSPDLAAAEIAGFLRAVVIERIDTAYANGAWHVLVLHQDARRKEESEQIESAIKDALTSWRDRLAAREGIARESILPDDMLAEIAHYAPTTERELSTIASAHGFDVSSFGATIVLEVKKMLDALIE